MEKKIPIDSYVAMIAGDDSYSGASLFSKKEKKKFNIISACYPEGHIENKRIDIEIDNMKRFPSHYN